MMDPKIFDEFARRLSAAMPPGLQSLQQDFEHNARAALQGALAKLDLVTREEFEVQSAVLARTREKVEALERRVAELEARLGKGTGTAPDEEATPGDLDMDGG